MKARSNDFLLLGAVILLLTSFVSMLVIPVYRYRYELQERRQQVLNFRSVIRPILQSDSKFEFVSFGANTGGQSGMLAGYVDSTNDLERLKALYSITLSNHPARVEFHVKINEHIFN